MTEEFKESEAEVKRESVHTKTPGTLLREARQAKKLNQSDVAKHLRLSVQWIKDIENDDYSHAAALIYVRGHLRSYARYVGISPDEAIAAFETLAMDEEFARAKALQERPVMRQAVPVISRSTRVISRRAVRWVTASAVVVLVVLVGVWWQGQKKHGVGMSQPQVVMQPKEDLTIQSSENAASSDASVNAIDVPAVDKTDHHQVGRAVLTGSAHH